MKTLTTAAQIEADRPPGFYPVSGASGLYLQIARGCSKSWVFKFRFAGGRREMGLGGYQREASDGSKKLTLAQARVEAIAARALANKGVDPIEARRAEKEKQRVAAQAKGATKRHSRKDDPDSFRTFALAFVDRHERAWRRPAESASWRRSFERWVFPHIGHMAIADVALRDVINALEEAWVAVPELAQRMRSRMQRIFDAAIASELYHRANPANARLVKTQLPASRRIIKHYRAPPLDEAPALFARIQAASGSVYRGIEFMILCTTRPSEARLAEWIEIDLARAQWTIPPEKMKGGRAHTIPLSRAALAVLDRQSEVRRGRFVFNGQRPDAPFSHRGFSWALREISMDLTLHGWRSTWRDAGADLLDVPREICELQLAHSLAGGRTEEAYRRGRALPARARALERYANWLMGDAAAAAPIIPFPKNAG
jgi:integrase